MRIAVNARLLLPNKLEGIGWFAHETTRRMVANNPQHQFVLLFDRPPAPEFNYGKNSEMVVLQPPARHPLLWYIWFEIAMARYLNNRKHRIDVLYSPEGYLSLHSHCPQVLTLHDINFHHHPEYLPKTYAWYLNRYTPRFVRKANQVLTVSKYSQTDICAAYNLPQNKVSVVYNGIDALFAPLSPIKIEQTRRKISNGEPYFIFVGSMHRRKNAAGLLKAFDLFKRNTNAPHRLILVGSDMFKPAEIQQSINQSPNAHHIIRVGHCLRHELAPLIGAAQALIFPSLFEGFGVPLAEAMSCGIPIASSNTTSMPEVAGDAALYFDPNNTAQMADAMTQLAQQPQLRQQLSLRGLERAKRFNWDISAQQVMQTVEQAAAAPNKQ